MVGGPEPPVYDLAAGATDDQPSREHHPPAPRPALPTLLEEHRGAVHTDLDCNLLLNHSAVNEYPGASL